MNFLDHLHRRLTFFDGATGTQLMLRGLKPGEVPESWNLNRPDDVLAVHKAYLAAGCQVIASNTFGAHPLKSENASAYVAAGMDIVRRAVDECGHEAWAALDMGPTGRLMKPFGDMSFEEAYNSFAGMVEAGRDKADLILIETQSDLFEVKAAVLAAKEHSDLPVVVTMSLNEQGMLLTGGTIQAMVTLLEGLNVDALGLNCGLGPAEMLKILPDLYSLTSIPLIVCPNAGLPVSVDGKAVYTLSPEEFSSTMEKLYECGARGLGGCCGTTPEHLRQTISLLAGRTPKPIVSRGRGRISSYTQAVDLKCGPYLVGERLNPTGKPRMKEALKNHDMDHLLLEAVRQVEAGARILDVNVGLPGLDEKAMMGEVVNALQGVVDVPLQLDSVNPEALEEGLRNYAGCALINSVNGKEASMAQIFPLAKKYGACVVALTLDENGIPDTAQERVNIALRIISEAAKYGIGPERIVVDPLCMAVSVSKQGALPTLQALGMLREKGVSTILGVSNVSFGLPQRPRINASFFTMALYQGLSLAIVNPLNQEMMDAWYTARPLLGMADGCQNYIDRFSAAPAPAQTEKADPALTLEEAVVRGLKGPAAALAEKMLSDKEPMDIINLSLVPALNRVGSAFEKGEMFLPQLLMSADAAGAGFDAVRRALADSGAQQKKLGKVVLATVRGDIHDIGKNIVKALLENYGFDVIDLGKDVPPEKVLEAAQANHVRLVGLSALMTTTVGAMEETIRLLRASGDYRIMVGGAVLTPSYAEEIGADFYAKDAMQSVRYAQQVYA